MSEFLFAARNLQQFVYTQNDSADNSENFDPLGIRTALLANARDRLKSLTILACGQDVVFMGSLAGFTGLQLVQPNSRLLIGLVSPPPD